MISMSSFIMIRLFCVDIDSIKWFCGSDRALFILNGTCFSRRFDAKISGTIIRENMPENPVNINLSGQKCLKSSQYQVK